MRSQLVMLDWPGTDYMRLAGSNSVVEVALMHVARRPLLMRAIPLSKVHSDFRY